MPSPPPPPVPRIPRKTLNWSQKTLICFVGLLGGLVVMLIVCRVAGLIRPFSIPSDSMAPAIMPGDQVMMEGFTYIGREPQRGDIVVFKTDGIPLLSQGTFFDMRVAGTAGDRVRISDRILYINDMPAVSRNAAGASPYTVLHDTGMMAMETNLIVPAGHFFVLGDNAKTSWDSRYWGFLPRQNIIGRVSFCYSPRDRAGPVK